MRSVQGGGWIELGPRSRGRAGLEEQGSAPVLMLVPLALVLVALLGLVAVGGVLLQTSAEAVRGGAPAELHPAFADAYGRAAQAVPGHVPECRIRPAVLAGVGRVEFTPGNSNGGQDVNVSPNGDVNPPVYGVPTDYGRAEGPMQFLPSTWATSGLDAAGTPGGDGAGNPQNIYDAALSAAVYLCRAVPGSPLEADEDLLSAFFAYNHSETYARTVLDWVHHFDRVSAAALSPIGTGDAADLLSNDRLIMTQAARGDLESGMVDSRLVAVLRAVLTRHSVAISVFKTGHSKYVAGSDRVSNHYACDDCPGLAMDIYWVDGEDVSPSSGASEAFVQSLMVSSEPLGIDEIGQPFPHFVTSSGTFRVFTDSGHRAHIHVGIDPEVKEVQPAGALVFVPSRLNES